MISYIIIDLISFFAILIFWPYIVLNPIHNFYESYLVNSHYQTLAGATFQGHNYPQGNVPRSYVPIWLFWVGSPPATVFLAVLGCFVIILQVTRKKKIPVQVLAVALTLFFPLVMIIALKPMLYGAMRQFLFLVVPMILLAVSGLISLTRYLISRERKMLVAGLIFLVLASQLQVILDMRNLHPYEYMYFSPLVGGLHGTYGQYDWDYWDTCRKPAAIWLGKNYRKYTTHHYPTISMAAAGIPRLWSEQLTAYLPKTFKIVTKDQNADFSISRVSPATGSHVSSPQKAHHSAKQSSSSAHKLADSKIIHTEKVEGYPVCTVKLNTGTKSHQTSR